jgi:hypothetical protein
MTSTVIIKAHVTPQKEVRVSTFDHRDIQGFMEQKLVEEFTLQDGGEAERSIYDGREISVREVTK